LTLALTLAGFSGGCAVLALSGVIAWTVASSLIAVRLLAAASLFAALALAAASTLAAASATLVTASTARIAGSVLRLWWWRYTTGFKAFWNDSWQLGTE